MFLFAQHLLSRWMYFDFVHLLREWESILNALMLMTLYRICNTWNRWCWKCIRYLDDIIERCVVWCAVHAQALNVKINPNAEALECSYGILNDSLFLWNSIIADLMSFLFYFRRYSAWEYRRFTKRIQSNSRHINIHRSVQLLSKHKISLKNVQNC